VYDNTLLLPCCFAAHFSREREPKVLITTCYKPSKGMYAFLAEMLVSGCLGFRGRDLQGFTADMMSPVCKGHRSTSCACLCSLVCLCHCA
jgi:hypothetical protein